MRTRALASAAALAAITFAAGCGGSSSGGTTPSSTNTTPPASTPATTAASTPAAAATAPSNVAAASKQVKKNFEAFFNKAGSPASKEKYIEGGAASLPTLKAAATLAKAQGASEGAKVKKVAFTSATMATVTYDLSSGGSVVLPGASGNAVLENGHWVVAKQTLCTLLNLAASGKAVPGCAS
jgi:hypothetical protein